MSELTATHLWMEMTVIIRLKVQVFIYECSLINIALPMIGILIFIISLWEESNL